MGKPKEQPKRVASGLDPFERKLPQIPDAERVILSAILQNSDLFRIVDPIISHTDFGYDIHRRIYLAMWSLAQNNERIDTHSVSVWLHNEFRQPYEEGNETARTNSDVQAIAEINNGQAVDIVPFAQRVKDWSARRQAIQICRTHLEGFYENDSPEEVITDLTKDLMKINSGKSTELVDLTAPLAKIREQLLAPAEQKKSRVLDTGFRRLDNIIGGIAEGTIIVIPARPKAGKSTITSQIIMHTADTTELASVVFLLEMDIQMQTMRYIQQITGENLKPYLTGKFPVKAQRRDFLLQTMERLKTKRIFLADEHCSSIEQIRSYLYRWKAKHPELRLGWVVIDHWNLMKGSEDVAQQRNNASELGMLAKEFETRFLVPAQCRKPSPKDEKMPPTMFDIQGSQALSEIATYVFILHRPKKGTGETKASDSCQLIFEAGRDTSDGATIQMIYMPSHAKFQEAQPPLMELQTSIYDPSES